VRKTERPVHVLIACVLVFTGVATIYLVTGNAAQKRPPSGFTINPVESEPFTLTDGYFQGSEAGLPVHLMHDFPRQQLWLGDDVHVWYAVLLNEGQQSLCTRRGEGACTMHLRLASLVDPGFSWVMDREVRIDDDLSVAFGFTVNREKTPLGNASLIFTLKKEGKTLFSHEIPVEVK